MRALRFIVCLRLVVCCYGDSPLVVVCCRAHGAHFARGRFTFVTFTLHGYTRTVTVVTARRFDWFVYLPRLRTFYTVHGYAPGYVAVGYGCVTFTLILYTHYAHYGLVAG